MTKRAKFVGKNYDWAEFEKFQPVVDKYAHEKTFAGQIANAMAYLCYRYFNDGDTFDWHCEDGNGNGYACNTMNFLVAHVPEIETWLKDNRLNYPDVLRVYDYTEILMNLFNEFLTEEFLEKYAKAREKSYGPLHSHYIDSGPYHNDEFDFDNGENDY